MNKDRLILRTRFIDRASHWFMVICFFLVAMSGLSWFFPSLNWLNGVFGTPQLARILHGIAIDRDDDVAALDPAGFGRTAVGD